MSWSGDNSSGYSRLWWDVHGIYIYIYICVCVCVWYYIHIYVCNIYIYICITIISCTCTHVCIFISTSKHTFTYLYAHTGSYMGLCACTVFCCFPLPIVIDSEPDLLGRWPVYLLQRQATQCRNLVVELPGCSTSSCPLSLYMKQIWSIWNSLKSRLSWFANVF